MLNRTTPGTGIFFLWGYWNHNHIQPSDKREIFLTSWITKCDDQSCLILNLRPMAPPKRNLLSRIIKSTSCKICRTLLMHVSVFATQSSHGHIFLQCYQFLILRSICIAPTKSFSTILPQILDAFRYILSHPSFLRARHYVKHKTLI